MSPEWTVEYKVHESQADDDWVGLPAKDWDDARAVFERVTHSPVTLAARVVLRSPEIIVEWERRVTTEDRFCVHGVRDVEQCDECGLGFIVTAP